MATSASARRGTKRATDEITASVRDEVRSAIKKALCPYFSAHPLLEAFPFDKVVVTIGDAGEDEFISATLETAVRWKTSSVSGDEYRYLFNIVCRDDSGGVLRRAVNHEPVLALCDLFAQIHAQSSKGTSNVRVQFYSKDKPFPAEWLNRAWDPEWIGKTDRYSDLVSAMAATLWRVATFRRGVQFEDKWSYCMHIGCADAPTKFYRLVRTFDVGGIAHAPDPDTVYIRHFCKTHSHRGNCGLDDSDANMVKVNRAEIDMSTV